MVTALVLRAFTAGLVLFGPHLPGNLDVVRIILLIGFLRWLWIFEDKERRVSIIAALGIVAAGLDAYIYIPELASQLVIAMKLCWLVIAVVGVPDTTCRYSLIKSQQMLYAWYVVVVFLAMVELFGIGWRSYALMK